VTWFTGCFGAIARSAIGAIAENLLNAQFSRQEEREADDYGAAFLKRKGQGRDPSVSVVMKPSALDHDRSFLCSHAAPEARAQRLMEKVRDPQGGEASGPITGVLHRLKGLLSNKAN